MSRDTVQDTTHEARRDLTQFFLGAVFTPGSYRAEEFAEACADDVADILGATSWRFDRDAATIDVSGLASLPAATLADAIRGTSIGALSTAVRDATEALLRKAGLVAIWRKP